MEMYSDGSFEVERKYSSKEQIKAWVEFIRKNKIMFYVTQVELIFIIGDELRTARTLINLN